MWNALRFVIVAFILGYPLTSPAPASAQPLACNPVFQECLCDPSTTDCRQPLLNLIDNEDIAIDVGFWFMEDSRFSTRLAAAKARGVAVRVLVDTKANTNYPNNVEHLNRLANAGIPMRKSASRYFHWKMMLFAEQNVVEFGSANFSPHAFVYVDRLVDFIDETVLFSNDADVVNSFKTRFDDAWVSSHFSNYANPIPLTRAHGPATAIDPELNLPPFSSTDLGGRSVARYRAETAATGGIDSIIYRISDNRHTNEIIAAIQRGVPVRIILEPTQYRDTVRYNHSEHADRIYAELQARGETWRLRDRKHLGANHQKLTLLHDQRMSIFGSQNWTTTSGQYEHNYFTTKPWMYSWYVDQFERKFNSNTETKPFVPLPPGAPSYRAPSTGSQIQASEVTLRWYAGLFAHKYDIYFGTSSNPPLLAADVLLGPSDSASDHIAYTVGNLSPDTTYFWKIVSKTMANLSSAGGVWNFRTGVPPQPGADDIVMWAARAQTVEGNWAVTPESTAAGGARLGTANAGAKVSSALAAPAHYFEMSFTAAAGVPYRLWLRGRATSNSWASDSVFVQFSDSVTSSGSPTWRIASTSATTVTIEDCTSCGLSAWGWNDNASNGTPGALGTLVYFAQSGEHTVRIQMREDGLAIDQIVLSRDAFLTAAPGTTKNDGTILPEAGGTSGGSIPPSPPPLPSPWQSADVGAVGPAGNASHSNGTFTVRGGGADVWGTTDAFHYAYRPLSGDGTIVARVASLSGSQSWVKVGVMIRASTSPSAAHAFMIVSKSKGLVFQYRPTNGASTLQATGPSGTAPRWVKLERTGDVITASVSSNGTAWTIVGSGTFTMPADVLIGLAAHSHTTSSLATATFDNVTVVSSGGVSAQTSLPSPWQSDDVGAVGPAGTASHSNGTFTVRGGGADVWGTTDAFHYAYRPLSGDGSIVARVASLSGSRSWVKVGVMIRASTSPSAAHAFMIVSKSKGLVFQYRPTNGASTLQTTGPSGTAPRWVRVQRADEVITASVSSNGTAWTTVGSSTFAMPRDALIGLASHSHTTSDLATATFDNVTIVN